MEPEQIQQSIQAVIDGLMPLAQKMQMPIEQLWSWSIQHNYAVAVSNIFIAIVIWILTFIYVKYVKWVNKNDTFDDHIIGVVLIGFFVATFFVISLYMLQDSIMRFVAPEWMTIQDIANLMKSQ